MTDQPTADAFQALARSSPWRWRTLHFRHRSHMTVPVEAWVRRPGDLLVRDPKGNDFREHGVPYTRGVVLSAVREGSSATPPPIPRSVTPDQVAPTLREDGLVETRPGGFDGPGGAMIDYDDPMWTNYSWVAMLDPVELSHHVEVTNVRTEAVNGRPAWRADLRALPGYEPRCGGGCCELLWSEAGWFSDCSDPADVTDANYRPVPPGLVFPDHYDVALDVQTGVVVRCLPVGGTDDPPWLEVDILEVDGNVDDLFDEAVTEGR